jgi:enamine deaminase RidA (YjgF/YER057c/UK114 family)
MTAPAAPASTPEQNLARLNLTLPEAPAPIGAYVPVRRSGSTLYLSGHLPPAGSAFPKGKVGVDLTVDQAKQAARDVGLNLLASLRKALGSLDKVAAVVKVVGLVNCLPDFEDHPKVINGCSELMLEVFGEAGKHARSALGAVSLPRGVPVEIEMIVEVA